MLEALLVNKMTLILKILMKVSHVNIFRSKPVVQEELQMQMVVLQRDFLTFVKNMQPKIVHLLRLDLWNGHEIFQRLNGIQEN